MDVLHAAGPQAGHVLDLWRLTLVLCTVVYLLVVAAFLLAIWRAPRASRTTPGDGDRLGRPEPGRIRTVVIATAASIAGLVLLVVASVRTDAALAATSPRDALHIEVTAQQWWWNLRYHHGDPARTFTTANELHVPVGRPVLLTLRSGDVIHSIWLPSVAGKKDLVPGRDTTHLLRVDVPGIYRGRCAEFCGAQHAQMALELVAEPADRYAAWESRQRQTAPGSDDPALIRGREVFLASTCVMCHAIAGTDASARRAPDLTHVGSRRRIAAGALPNTPDAMAAWISDPQRFKPGSNMPAHDFAPDELQALVAFLGSLQ